MVSKLKKIITLMIIDTKDIKSFYSRIKLWFFTPRNYDTYKLKKD